MSAPRRIRGPEEIRAGLAHLERIEPRFAAARALVGEVPLRLRPGGFRALAGAIVSQQLSVAAADGIWRRMEAAGLVEPAAIAAADDATLRAVGLSRQKMRYLRALATAGIDFAALEAMDDEAVIATLTAVPGIGRWTAEIYAMFSLGRPDVFAAADLALQEAARMLFDLAERPRERELRALAEPWAPWRAVAARLLWAYYRAARGREGVR